MVNCNVFQKKFRVVGKVADYGFVGHGEVRYISEQFFFGGGDKLCTSVFQLLYEHMVGSLVKLAKVALFIRLACKYLWSLLVLDVCMLYVV